MKNKLLQLSGLIACTIMQYELHADVDRENIAILLAENVSKNKLPFHEIIKNQRYSLSEKLALIKKIADAKEVDINAQDANGKTALNLVIFYKGAPEIVKLLISSGADVNEPDLFNETPLHNAIRNEDITAAKILVAHGADVRFQNDKGLTPLDLAQSPTTMAVLGLQS